MKEPEKRKPTYTIRELRDMYPNARFNPAGTPENISDEIKTILPPFVRGLLENPDDRPIKDRRGSRVFFAAMELPSHAPALEETWDILADSLTAIPTQPHFYSEPRMRAFFIADVLLQQTRMPLKRKRELSKSVKSYVLEDGTAMPFEDWSAQHFGEPQSKQPKNSPDGRVIDLVNAFRKKMEHDTQEPKTKQDVLSKIHLIDIFKAMRGGNFLAFWENFAAAEAEKFETMFKASWVFSYNNRFIPELFHDQALEDINPALGVVLMTNAGEPNPAISDYFFRHANVQEQFWKQFIDQNLLIELDEQEKRLPQVRNLLSIPGTTYFTVIGFFRRDPGVVGHIATASLPNATRREQQHIFRALITAAAAFKSGYPDHKNNSIVGQALQETIQSKSAQLLASELAVLQDEQPGILTVNSRFEARAHAPRTGQSKDDLLSETNQLGEQIVYISKADWTVQSREDEISVTTPKSTKENGIIVQPIKTEFLARWGEVGVVGPMDQPALLNHLDSQLSKLRPDNRNGDLEKLVSSYSGLTQRPSRQRAVVLPDLLPLTDPISALGKVGIIGIEQDGEFVTLAIDSRRAGIQSDSQRLTLNGHVNRDKTVSFAWGGKKFTDQALNPHFRAAVALGCAAPISEYQLDKQEVSELHSLVKNYNRDAKRESRPQVSLDERSDFDKQTVTFIGKKPVLLHLTS